jgi:hypothetical protein
LTLSTEFAIDLFSSIPTQDRRFRRIWRSAPLIVSFDTPSRACLVDHHFDMSGASSTSSPQPNESPQRPVARAQQALMEIDGVLGAAIIDLEAGRTLVSLRVEGDEDLNLALAGPESGPADADGGAGALAVDGDRVIALDDETHLVRPGPTHETLCYYLVVDREDGDLDRARRAIDRVDGRLVRD